MNNPTNTFEDKWLARCLVNAWKNKCFANLPVHVTFVQQNMCNTTFWLFHHSTLCQHFPFEFVQRMYQ